MLFFLFFLLTTPFCCVIEGIIVGYLSVYYLFVLFALPMSVTLFYLMFQYVYSPDKKFSPHFLMGPMLNWNKIKIMGMDCFLIRWLLARNMFSFFCLIVIIVCLIF